MDHQIYGSKYQKAHTKIISKQALIIYSRHD